MSREREVGPDVRSRTFDALIALFLVAISLSIAIPLVDRDGLDRLGIGILLLVVHSGCLAWRRRAPLVVLGLNLATAVGVIVLLRWPSVTVGVAVLVAVYSVALFRDRAISLPAGLATLAVMVFAFALSDGNGDASTVAGNVLVVSVAWSLGDTQRERRGYVARLEQRTAELERARHDLAEAAVAEERLRIARELHDVVAHSMGMIAVQAGVGAHVIDSRPDEAKRSLHTIEQASKSALGEIRGMLGLLRATDEGAETSPSPGVANLRELAREIERAGVRVELQVDDATASLPGGLQLTIFRIVQEALTNTVKHARATRATVSVRVVEGAARVDVVDDGTASTDAAGGHGIVGMRERASMHGGRFDAGPLAEGGFRVTAELPLAERVG